MNNYTEYDQDLILDLKNNYGKSKLYKSKYFINKYKISFDRLHYLVKRLKLSNKRKTTLDEIKPLAIQDYKNGLTAFSICQSHRITDKTLFRWLDEEKIERRTVGSYCIYKCNQDYFQVIDSPEKAYWVGFIAADGYLHDKKLGMSLQKSDVCHLELLCKALGANFKFSPFRNAYQLWVGRKKIYQDLKNLGISERKTYSLGGEIFDFIPEEFRIAFCHGYFDGDGCVGLNKNRIRKDGAIAVYFHLIANKSFLERYAEEIEKATKVKLGKISFAKRTKQSYFINKHLGKIEIISLYEAFYKSGASSTHFLERKRLRFYQKYEREIT